MVVVEGVMKRVEMEKSLEAILVSLTILPGSRRKIAAKVITIAKMYFIRREARICSQCFWDCVVQMNDKLSTNTLNGRFSWHLIIIPEADPQIRQGGGDCEWPAQPG